MAIRKTAVLGLGAVAMLFCATCQASQAPTQTSAALPMVYVQRSPGWQLIDWTGKAQGLIESDHVGIPYQSPDGARVAWQPQGDWQVVDRKGRVLSHLDLSRSRSIAWADDSSGLCVVRAASDNQAPGVGQYVLDFVSAASGESRRIASFAMGM